jgi:hypothetical protein
VVKRKLAQRRQRGAAYFWALMIVLFISLGVGSLVERVSTAEQRMREADLLYVGNLYRDAFRQYFESTPAGMNPYPQQLEDLLHDPRYPVTRRYLRRLYFDPVTGKSFEPITADGTGLKGVRSSSLRAPIKKSGFPSGSTGFSGAKSYRAWEFTP